MRKYGSHKKNPNPPWPNQQSVVVVPNEITASSIGRYDESIRTIPTEKIVITDKEYPQTSVSESFFEPTQTTPEPRSKQNAPKENMNEDVFENREKPIMDYNPETTMRSSDFVQNGASRRELSPNELNMCGLMPFGKYLCNQTGKLARIEFLFGENTHIEKTGVLQSVGKDFIVISEPGTNNSIVCSVNNIKFINIYGV